MEDNLLKAFFEINRWKAAIDKGVVKDIHKGVLARLCSPEGRASMAERIERGVYVIQPPHTAKIPKEDPGEFRTVYVNEPEDRILLAIANDLFFEKMTGCVHPRCMSYLKGVGCGKVVKACRDQVVTATDDIIGFKADLTKYFDSVPIEYIDKALDMIEAKCGKSNLIDVIRNYYHSDTYFNSETKQMEEKYQSLKQGCSVAAWLADVILYHIDEKLSSMGWYIRYCDDILFIGPNWRKAKRVLESELKKMNMSLNPKKVEVLSKKRYFKFLGFSIRGNNITLSRGRLKKFQKEIERRTSKCKAAWKAENHKESLEHSTKSVCRFLYKGDGKHSWASQVLPVVNVISDLHELDHFVLDCLRAVYTSKRRTGGLGYDRFGTNGGVVLRGRGQNVTANRGKLDDIPGYRTIVCMRNALITSKAAYDALCASM